MEFKILAFGPQKIAGSVSAGIVVNDIQDALDLMANADYQGARRIILYEQNLNRGFFDLRTGLAGEILQKYSNYRIKLAVIGEFGKFNSKSLDAFIRECNRGNQVFFVSDLETAIAKLTG